MAMTSVFGGDGGVFAAGEAILPIFMRLKNNQLWQYILSPNGITPWTACT
ncbi:hypothetical protein [Fluviicoccus keumensis]|nr:hypothetical protein [Fluviicoccus keumensis]